MPKRNIKGGGGLSRDATVSKRAEEALRESEERFRKAFQSSPVGIIMTRLSDNHIVDVNDTLLRVWGYTREEVVGRTAEDLNVWVNPEDRLNILQALRENKPVSMFEAQFRRKSGELAWGVLSATPVDIGGEPHLIVLAQDVTERKRAEEALRAANETMRTLVTASPSAIICIDLEGRATVWNSAAERIFGWTAREVIGKPLNLAPPEKADEVNALRQQALRGETVTGYEGKRLRKDGSLVDVNVAFGPVCDPQGRVTGVLSVLTNITERKRTEEKLRVASETVHTLVTASPSAIIAVDLEGRATAWNRAAERIFGWTAREVIGKPLPMTPPDKAEEVKALRQRALRGETVTGYEGKRLRKDGSLIDVNVGVGPVHDQDGRVVGTIGVMTDISARKRSEEKLNRTTAQLNALVQSSPAAIFGIDKERRVTTWSPAAERMYGWSAHEVMGKPIHLVPEDRREEGEVLRQRSLRGEPLVDYETRRLRKDGTLVDVSLSTAPLRNAEGEIVGTMSVHVDISARKQAEEKLNRTTAQLNTLVQSSPAAIFGIDKERLVTTWSPAAERMYGWSAQEVLGKPIPTIPEDRREEYKVLRQRSLRGEPLVDYETRRLRKDGTLVDVSLSTAPLRNAEGEIVGTMGVHVDISARKQAEEKLLASASMLHKTLFSTVEVICKIVEARDPYTSGHEERVGALAMAIAHEMGLPDDRIEGVRVAAAIHDIGKLQVPIEILSRPGKLMDAEFALIKTHPQVGYDILSGFEFPWPIANIARQHHERMDGSGYPDALRGEDILLEARVLTVADVVESMSSHRPYRPAHTLEESLAEIEQHRGTKYDPQAVDACLKLFREKGYKLE